VEFQNLKFHSAIYGATAHFFGIVARAFFHHNQLRISCGAAFRVKKYYDGIGLAIGKLD
jgi:hypothetical protein